MDSDGSHGATDSRRRKLRISSIGMMKLKDQKPNKRTIDELVPRNCAMQEIVAKSIEAIWVC